MSHPIHIWPTGDTQNEKLITRTVIVEGYQPERERLWYRLPEEYKTTLSENLDPFVVGLLVTAMRVGKDLVIHDRVSPSLLRNLEEFQSVFATWWPQRYRKIEIQADIEEEPTNKKFPRRAIAAFSGGLDSCFTVWRHATAQTLSRKRQLQAGMMVHGFDIPLEREDVWRKAIGGSKSMLDSLGLDLIPVATNLHAYRADWRDTENGWATSVVSSLMLFQGGYTTGLIGSTIPYFQMIFPTASNPVTDPLLSSNAFSVVHDGAAFTRSEKAGQLANWPEALQNLRVCFELNHKGINCCKCEKCIRTILNFRVMGLGLPPCFQHDVTDSQILKLVYPRFLIREYSRIRSAAKKARIYESWVKVLNISLWMNQIGCIAKQVPPVRRSVRFILGRR